MAGRIFSGRMQFFDVSGNVLNAGTLDFFVAGTTTRLDTYSDYARTTANANPVVLSAGGQADIYLGTGLYDVVVKDSTGATVGPNSGKIENVTADDTAIFAVADEDSSSATAYTATAVAGLGATDSISTGQVLFLYGINQNNTGALTLNIGSSEGAVNVKKLSGGSLTALVANDIDSDAPAILQYDGTQWVLQSQGGAGSPASIPTVWLAGG